MWSSAPCVVPPISVVTDDELLPSTGSVNSLPCGPTDAVFVAVPPDAAETVIVISTLVPAARDGKLHVIVVLPVHDAPVALTKVTSDGSPSVTFAPAAASGPLFPTTSVYEN